MRAVARSSIALAAGLMIAHTVGANAAPSRHAPWVSDSALTVAPDRVEVGVVSEAAWGVNERLELRAHALAFLIWPHLEAKLRIWDGESWQLSSRHRVSYPTLLLGLVTKEGTLGLLPPDTRSPQALLLDDDIVLSRELFRNHWLSIEAGASIALRSRTPTVLLDFPFLYQRLAALHAPVVPRAGIGLEGPIGSSFGYAATLRQRWLLIDPVDGATATDVDVRIHLSPWRHHRFSAGALWSRALFPVGERAYTLPYVDYRIAF